MAVVERVNEYNRGRDPELLALKLRALKKSAFIFLRGTCHLFYERLPKDTLLEGAPVTWLCGDLHLQNMGSYKGDNRLVYYDINDFDEAALGPCTLDLLRLLTSILVSARELKVRRAEAIADCVACVDAYAEALRFGAARWIETETAKGFIHTLLAGAARPRRVQLLNARTIRRGGRRQLRTDGRKALPASEEDRAHVFAFMEAFAARHENPRFFELLDVARRIAGTGSLGGGRFVMLVEGKGSPDGNYLLDLKRARPSSLVPHLRTRQPRWINEAERVTQVQRRMQAVSQAFLSAETMAGEPYVLRDLQPSEDRVDFSRWQERPAQRETTIAAMGRLLAWDQLRSSGRQRSAIADDLIAFGSDRYLRKGIVELALQCSSRVESDWKEYRG